MGHKNSSGKLGQKNGHLGDHQHKKGLKRYPPPPLRRLRGGCWGLSHAMKGCLRKGEGSILHSFRIVAHAFLPSVFQNKND